MIDLLDLIENVGIGVKCNNLKVHLACHNGREHPIDEYYAGCFNEWQQVQANQNFKGDMVLSLIDMGQGTWLFAGVYKVRSSEEIDNYWHYNLELLPKQENLLGRIIVSYTRSRASYVWYKPEMHFPVVEIRREKLTIDEFPGYNAVVLPHGKLRIIAEQKIASWYGALANIKGIYLITDTTTGKHYVGSATGDDGIWQRWCSYAHNGHGGNKDLRTLLKEEGPEYRANFQYSILEIADTHASDKGILMRESYWKDVLRSREFGLNRN